MFKQIVTTTTTTTTALLLIFALCICSYSTNPVVSNDPIDWSTRNSDNVDATSSNIAGPIKYNFDDSSEEIDSSFSKREVPPVLGPLDAPLVWGARIESAPTSSSSLSPVGGVDILPSSSGTTVVAGAGSSIVGGGGDNKQKVDWALNNPGDNNNNNKKLYSSNDAPDVIEQKKEDSVALGGSPPETPRGLPEYNLDSNSDLYKDILPTVLTSKRRLAEADKPVQSSSPSVAHDVNVSTAVPSAPKTPEKVAASPPTSSSVVDIKGNAGGQISTVYRKPSDKTVPQHVYTEDQFPSVITIKGREYLVIPHKSSSFQPSAQAQASAGSWYPDQAPGQVSFDQSAPVGNFGSPFFTHYPPLQSDPSITGGSKVDVVSDPNQPVQSSWGSSVAASSAPSFPSSSSPVAAANPSTGHQFVPTFTRYPVQSHELPSSGQAVNQQSQPSFPLTSKYPIYHSSAFTNPNIHSSNGKISDHSVPANVFPNFVGQFGPFPFQSPQGFPSPSQVTKNYEFFTPSSHHVSRVVSVPSAHAQGAHFVSQSASSSSSASSAPTAPGSSPAQPGEITGSVVNVNVVNPNFVHDPLFSPKLQDPVAVQTVNDGVSQQDSFVNKPIKPESNLHAPPQIPSWNPYGFSVVAGSYPVQSSSVAAAASPSSSGSPSNVQSTPTSSLSSPSASPSSSSSSSQTHVESPVTVTVDTKFPQQSISPYYSSSSSSAVASSSSSSSENNNNGVSNPESAPPSVTVGSFNVNSAADQPVKGQPQPQPQQQQQDQQQVGVAGETLVPTTTTTFVDNNNQFVPNSPYSSSGYFVPSIDPVSSTYPSPSASFSSSSSSSASSSPAVGPSPSQSPSQFGFPDQQQFFAQPWQSVSWFHGNPIPVTSSGYFGDDSTPTYNVHPHYHHQGQLFYKSKRSGPDYDFPVMSQSNE